MKNTFPFYFSLAMFSLLCFLYGFMVGDSKEIINASSISIFKSYLVGCEIALVGAFYFVYKFRKEQVVDSVKEVSK